MSVFCLCMFIVLGDIVYSCIILLEISLLDFRHSVTFIGPNNEMYFNILSNQTIFLTENRSDLHDRSQEL